MCYNCNVPTNLNFVYLLRSDNGYYKIGVSKHPAKRVNQLQTGSSHRIVLIEMFQTANAFLLEKSLKNKYSPYHVSGEWFDLPFEEKIAFGGTCKYIDNNLKMLIVAGNIFL